MAEFFTRELSNAVTVGGLTIGGGAPSWVQSMTNTDTHDLEATLAQVRALEAAGCDIVRLAVPDREAAKTFAYLKEQGIETPLVAHIHFDHRIALAAVAPDGCNYLADSLMLARIERGNGEFYRTAE